MPTNGGRWVIDLKIGTKINPPTPRKNTILRCTAVKSLDPKSPPLPSGTASSPFKEKERTYAGITIETIDGRMISFSTPPAVITPLFQSMMVVTSPIGEKAPPELAAITTRAAYMIRSLWSLTSLRRIIIITMDVVRLSRIADNMNVMKAMRQSRAFLLLVFRVSRTKLKPPFWSTSSTIVMAPIRKNSVVAVLPRWCSIVSLTTVPILSPMAVEMY